MTRGRNDHFELRGRLIGWASTGGYWYARHIAINLELARTPDQRALVGKQGGGKPAFALATDNCDRDFQTLKARDVTFDGEPQRMPYGTGVTLDDLYGNKIYLNEDRHSES